MKSVSLKQYLILVVTIVTITATGCLTSKKIDNYVAKQYDNQLPKPSKKQSAAVTLQSSIPSNSTEISSTIHKMDKFLPLLVYWHIKESQNCTLNAAIAQNNISNALTVGATQNLMQKLNGQKLELTLEEAPAGFSLIDDSHVIWIIYAINWTKVYVKPDEKDLVVSYKVMQRDSTFKTGKVTVRNMQTSKNLRFFQSWKSAISEYIQRYNSNLTVMTRSLVEKLSEEL